MEVLIYNYEGEVLKYLNRCLSELRTATYASDEELLLAISEIKQFPAFFYSREEFDWQNNKILTIRDGSKYTKFCQFEQTYKGTIILEDQKDAQKVASKLRFYWDENPFLNVSWPTGEDMLKVQLRLLYIKIIEKRRPDNKKGACRAVEFSWKSSLFQNPLNDYNASLVEKVKIYLTDDKRAVFKDKDGNELIINDLIKEYNG